MGNIETLRKSTETNQVQIDADIANRIHSVGSPTIRLPLPDYVEHQEGVPRVGALSAEAVVRDYEAAAQEIESMGAELVEAAKKCEAMTAEVHTAIAYMRDTAAAYREDAKKIFKRIEDCALFTENVRKTCEEVKRKMVEGNTT
jgi:hypothetical protein